MPGAGAVGLGSHGSWVWRFLGVMKKFWNKTEVLVAQHHECTKRHWAFCFTMGEGVNFMLCVFPQYKLVSGGPRHPAALGSGLCTGPEPLPGPPVARTGLPLCSWHPGFRSSPSHPTVSSALNAVPEPEPMGCRMHTGVKTRELRR